MKLKLMIDNKKLKKMIDMVQKNINIKKAMINSLEVRI